MCRPRQRGEIAAPLRRRGDCGAGRERSDVSAVRRWDSAPVNRLARVAAPACFWLKSSSSRNYSAIMAKWTKIAALGISTWLSGFPRQRCQDNGKSCENNSNNSNIPNNNSSPQLRSVIFEVFLWKGRTLFCGVITLFLLCQSMQIRKTD